MTTLIVAKRYLTQSEKEKMYLKRGYTPDGKSLGTVVVECQQNVVENRKLKQKLDKFEKEQRESINKINAEQHNMKMQYKSIQKLLNTNRRESETESDNYFTEDDLVQSGFSFHSNGERRSSRGDLLAQSINQLQHDVEVLQDTHNHANQAPDSIHEINEITKMVDNISACARRHSTQSSEQKYHHNPFLRAHQDDYVWHLESGSARKLSQSQLQGPKSSFHRSIVVQNPDSDPERAKRTGQCTNGRCGRAQCVSCQFHMKQKANALLQRERRDLLSCKKSDSKRFILPGRNSFHIDNTSVSSTLLGTSRGEGKAQKSSAKPVSDSVKSKVAAIPQIVLPLLDDKSKSADEKEADKRVLFAPPSGERKNLLEYATKSQILRGPGNKPNLSHEERITKFKKELEEDVIETDYRVERFLRRFSGDVPTRRLSMAAALIQDKKGPSEPLEKSTEIVRRRPTLPLKPLAPTMEELKECRYLREYERKKRKESK